VIVDLKNLQVDYGANGQVLRVLDIPAWQMAANEQVAISGPSGSGKSTLLHVIAGLLSPSAGTVSVCGQELTGLGEAERDRFRAKHIGYIFQNFNLLQGYTALENVLMGMVFSSRKPNRDAAAGLLSEMGLSQRMKHYPSEMSIGEQQRVAIARSLAKQPDLILADEPTGSLDPKHTLAVVEKLRDACREHGCSLLVVSHEQQVISSFEKRVAFLEMNRAFADPGQGRPTA
jgi:putative ABC transport system ATP-binding protein